MSAVLAGDLTPAGQRAVTGPVGQRPVPRLPLKLPARTTMTRLGTDYARPVQNGGSANALRPDRQHSDAKLGTQAFVAACYRRLLHYGGPGA